MTKTLWLTVAGWLVASGMAGAQPTGEARTYSTSNEYLLGLVASDGPKEMYEDIEIFRRILEGVLPRLPGNPPAAVDHPLGTAKSINQIWDKHLYYRALGLTNTWKALASLRDPHWVSDPAGAEGVYLKGSGIVYSMTFPLYYQKPVGDPAKPTPKP